MADLYGAGGPSPSGSGYGSADQGTGWVAFAGIMLAIVGLLNIIYGIAAISDSHVYARNTHYVISDLKAWGWALTLVGTAQFCAAFSIWARSEWGRWVGLATAGVNAIVQLMILPGAPFIALALFSVDVLIIYGLVAYGGRRGT